MQCISCEQTAIIDQPFRCREHFIEDFEKKVKETIERFDLLREGTKIAVAASGGKDSLTVLTLLKRWYGDVTAIAIDEGIADYREHSLVDLRKVCEQHNIPLLVRSYEDFAGMPLDKILEKGNFHSCAICGTFRRHLISVASKGFDVLATGHNADDEAQTILMNLLRGTTDVFGRGGPKTGAEKPGFVQRVKPLYFCTEKEVTTYAFIHGFVGKFSECPNAPDGYRRVVRDTLNWYSSNHPGAKHRILTWYLAKKHLTPTNASSIVQCERCGEPAAKPVCKACEFMEKVRALSENPV